MADLTVSSPFLTKNTYVSAAQVGTLSAGFMAGVLSDSTSYTSFTLEPAIVASQNFTGGTILVYGYVK